MANDLVFDWYGTLWSPGAPDGKDAEGIHPALIAKLKYLYSQGIEMAIISNTNRATATSYMREKLASLGILHLFSVVVGSATIGIQKPDRDLFTLVAKFFNRQPHNIVMIGDSDATDGGARQVGWKFKKVQTGTASIWVNQLNDVAELTTT